MLPVWANYTPNETRAARRSTYTPPDLHARLQTLAGMPGLTSGQKARLVHRSRGWIDQFLASPSTPNVTFEEARALYCTVGLNGITGPFMSDQAKAGITAEQFARVWGIKGLRKSQLLLKKASTGRHVWW